jgi:hypothetical protein
MLVIRKFFPSVMQDNDSIYLASLQGALEAVDEFSEMEIVRTPTTYNFRLIPSLPKYTNILIEELIKFHNIIGIRMNMGKSIKSTAVITFSIELPE